MSVVALTWIIRTGGPQGAIMPILLPHTDRALAANTHIFIHTRNIMPSVYQHTRSIHITGYQTAHTLRSHTAFEIKQIAIPVLVRVVPGWAH